MSQPKGSRNRSIGEPGRVGCFADIAVAQKSEEHDYSFLAEYEPFSIGAHSQQLKRMFDLIDASRIRDDAVFLYTTAEYVASVIARKLKFKTKDGEGKTQGLIMNMSRRKSIVLESLFPKFSSRPINDGLIFDIAMLIVGNMNILAEGQAVVPNYDMKHPVWIPMTVVDVKDDLEKPMNKRVSFFADSGIFAGSTMVKYMTSKFIRYVLSQIGMSRRMSAEIRDIFGTKMSIRLERQKGQIGLTEFDTSSSQENYNKSLFKVRHGDRPCHLGMSVNCSDCLNGTDVCDFAVYKQSEKPVEAEENK